LAVILPVIPPGTTPKTGDNQVDATADPSCKDGTTQHSIDTREPTRNRLHKPGSARLLADRWIWAAEQALQQPGLTWPGGDQDLAGHLPGCIPQRQRYDRDVIQWADHRQELRQQVDREEQPQPRQRDHDL
jgi:hypothetical protein